jgi:hypothetical protein
MTKAGMSDARGIIAQLAPQRGGTKQPTQIKVQNHITVFNSKAVLIHKGTIRQDHLRSGDGRDVRSEGI